MYFEHLFMDAMFKKLLLFKCEIGTFSFLASQHYLVLLLAWHLWGKCMEEMVSLIKGGRPAVILLYIGRFSSQFLDQFSFLCTFIAQRPFLCYEFCGFYLISLFCKFTSCSVCFVTMLLTSLRFGLAQ